MGYIFTYTNNNHQIVSIRRILEAYPNSTNAQQRFFGPALPSDCSETVYHVTPCPCKGHIRIEYCSCPTPPKYIKSSQIINFCDLQDDDGIRIVNSNDGGGGGGGSAGGTPPPICLGEKEEYYADGTATPQLCTTPEPAPIPLEGTSIYDDEIIINNLTGKARCVYEKLRVTSNKFREAIQKFDGDFPVSHLTYELNSNLPSNTNAVTLPPSNYMITIQLNSNNITNRATLMVARTIIHETVHAEMFRKLLSIANNGGDLNGLTKNQLNTMLRNGDFPGIYEYYTNYGTKFQHQQMADHYIDVISNALASFDNNQHNQQFYKDISWVGLQSTDAWNNFSPSEQTRINNVIKNFNHDGNKTCN